MARLINHNGHIVNESDFRLGVENRGLTFGDGFFESCLFENGQCKLLPYHLLRIERAAKRLKLELTISKSELALQIAELLQKENLSKSTARVKVIFYRNGDGAYTPKVNTASFLITAKKYTVHEFTKNGLRCGLAKEHYISSGGEDFKCLSSSNYVRASIEKKERGFDELILLNENDQIAETTASNIWWVKNDTVYTPNCGGVKGVFRAYLFEVLKDEGIKVKEGCFTKEDLLAADEAFLTNAVQGINSIGQIDDRYFKGKMAHYLHNATHT